METFNKADLANKKESYSRIVKIYNNRALPEIERQIIETERSIQELTNRISNYEQLTASNRDLDHDRDLEHYRRVRARFE
jgi:hypothetical protein